MTLYIDLLTEKIRVWTLEKEYLEAKGLRVNLEIPHFVTKVMKCETGCGQDVDW
jgi:hypothetical protein